MLRTRFLRKTGATLAALALLCALPSASLPRANADDAIDQDDVPMKDGVPALSSTIGTVALPSIQLRSS